ncbi:MAG: SagB/ThcOx family dehydrogenase [Chloroflexota bacterium]
MSGRNKHLYRICLPILAGALIFLSGCGARDVAPAPTSQTKGETMMKLPEPRYDSDFSLEKAIVERRSVRDYADQSLKLEEVSQLLWAAQGITSESGLRSAPSAGALYPLELYAVVGKVTGLDAGVYRYEPEGHQLAKVLSGDLRAALARAALGQDSVGDGTVSFVFTAVYGRTTGKYGERGERYVHMEAGHAAENLLLEAVALGLGAVPIGAFYDDEVAKLLNLGAEEVPLYIIPVGRK